MMLEVGVGWWLRGFSFHGENHRKGVSKARRRACREERPWLLSPRGLREERDSDFQGVLELAMGTFAKDLQASCLHTAIHSE